MAAFAFASASSSQVPSGKKYDVFISFRGLDVRSGFLSHLKKELRQKKINVYVDDRLERGEEISSALMKAIQGSVIALVIFSKDYASSKWCLAELVEIMKCKEAGQQIVIPIFYHINSSDVQNQKGTYEEAFTHHEKKFKDNVQNLQIWRSVLEKAASLSGYDLLNFQDESNLINAIVGCVLKKLEENSPIDPRSQLIGFHQNFISVESLMKIESQEEVRTLGIWGPGGIGKTTLACAIFDKFSSEFESHCFLENVREESTTIGGLSSLRQKLLSKLLDEKNPIDVNRALKMLKQKKVLIVLDDVDKPKQLKDLAGQQLYLGRGSRVIATSRDKHVLRSGGIHEKCIYEVKELNVEESFELFCIHAFNQSHPNMEYEELSKRTVAIAKGIPLALEVLACHFHSREEAYWESELTKLQKYPHQQIQNMLKVSYDGLDPMDREIFLDIAFFFVGKQKDEVIHVLEACDFKAISGTQNLIDKALIKLDGYDHIVMHDLIREMAEQIVREECIKHPERRSRLKDVDEICSILKDNKGTDEIEGIVFDVSRIKYLKMRANIFSKMKNLRILRVFNSTWWNKMKTCIELPSNLDSFPDKLRYFQWDHYPLKSLPLDFCPKSLVELRMMRSNVIKLWDGVQDLVNLRTINLHGSHKLMELPDFSMAHRLEIVDLSECSRLRSVHTSILSLHTLVELEVSDCYELESLESQTHLESLVDLGAFNCGLKKLCLSSKKLTEIVLDQTELEILHLPIGRFTELRELVIFEGERLRSLLINELCCLTNLEVFHVRYFKQEIHIEELHSLFDAWRNLKSLCLMGWSYLSEIPGNIKCLTRLQYLSLEESGVETLPASVSHLSSLTQISLRECKMLKSILGLPPMLQELDACNCTLLETVSSDSLVFDWCDFRFKNCVKLDECSLRFIEELTHSSYTSSPIGSPRPYGSACYVGNRVPKWMKYKQTMEASNTIEFSCNREGVVDILLCCVGSHLDDIWCSVSCDDNIKSDHPFAYNFEWDLYELYPDFSELNSDHVFLWHMGRGSFGAGTSDHIKISCEFFLNDWDDEGRLEACGVHVIYESELGQKRKRVADIGVEGLPPTKQHNNSGISQPTPLGLALQLGLATTRSNKSPNNFICHPLQLKFVHRMKQKDPLQLKHQG